MAEKNHRKITTNNGGDKGLNLDVLAEVLVTRYLMDCMNVAAKKEKESERGESLHKRASRE